MSVRVSKDDPPQMFGAGRKVVKKQGGGRKGGSMARGSSVTWGRQGP